MLANLLKNFTHLFYPQFCAGCGSDSVDSDQILCLDCMMKLPETGFFEMEENLTKEIFTGRLSLAHAASMYYCAKSSVLHELIHQLKYKGRKDIGIFLGKMIGVTMIEKCSWLSNIDLLVPVPLHQKREKERGYNQAQLIAEGISEITNIPIDSNLLIRRHNTSSQTHKGRTARTLSMLDQFELHNQHHLKGKNIALIDDLVTTGATLEFCGLELLKMNDTKLSIITTGRAIH